MGDTYSIASEAEANRKHQKAHRIYIEPTSIRGDRGQYYRVNYRGAPLIDETWNPEFEACRALVARGITGRLEIWRYRQDHPDVIIPDIAKTAEWTVEENEKWGPRFTRWRPRPEDAPRKAISLSDGIAPAAVLEPADRVRSGKRPRLLNKAA